MFHYYQIQVIPIKQKCCSRAKAPISHLEVHLLETEKWSGAISYHFNVPQAQISILNDHIKQGTLCMAVISSLRAVIKAFKVTGRAKSSLEAFEQSGRFDLPA